LYLKTGGLSIKITEQTGSQAITTRLENSGYLSHIIKKKFYATDFGSFLSAVRIY